MTVAELIAKLQALPQHVPVVTYNDDDNLAVLTEPPRLEAFFRYDEPDIVFYGEPDADEQAQGASLSFAAVCIGVAP